MSRIRVVFSIGELHGGGSERQIVNALIHLDRRRFEPHLYLVYRSGPLLPLVPDDVPITSFEERDDRSPSLIPGSMHRRRVRDMQRFLQELQPDVSYDRTFLMTLIAADAAQRVGIPNVSTVVTDPQRGFAPVAGRWQSIKRRRLGQLYHRSNAVLAVSAGAARSAEAFYGLRPNSVVTQYNGVDVNRVRIAASSDVDSPWWNAPPKQDSRLVRIVSAGRLNHDKGFHLLIDAVDRLQSQYPAVEFRLAVLGEGPSRRQLQDQIDRLQLTEHVSLTGFRENAPAWYRSADLFVLASLVEGLPNVLLEAMVCGTPVVSTRCQHGPEEILANGKFGILCGMSADSLSAAIGEFVQNPSTAGQQASAADQHVESMFSQTAAIHRLEAILDSAVRRK